MAKFTVSKSILIKAPQEKIYGAVRDFRQWPTWSPWLIAEPDCGLTYGDDGNSYEWSGNIVGAGRMEIEEETASSMIRQKLTFIKPWKSVNEVQFTLTPQGDGVEVNWTMNGSLPFFLFWMKGMMVAFIGMDYQRGLNMLKDYVETGSVPSRLSFDGTKSVTGFRYVAVRTQCTMDEIGPAMDKDHGRLKEFFSETGLKPCGPSFSIYHSWNMVKGTTDYTLGFPIETRPTQIPPGFTAGELPSVPTYAIRHTGPYRHLGNAWASGMMHERARLFQQDKKIPPFEIYENSPDDVPESDVVTTIHFPTK